MNGLTEKDLESLCRLMTGEQLACKKARVYANTLTDVVLCERLKELADGHERRFRALLTVLNGGGV